MKLKHILLELNELKKELSFDETVILLKENCQVNFENCCTMDKFINRGRKSNKDFEYFNPSLGNRKSANTYNYYTLMIDNFPEWSTYPKRSRSLICTTNQGLSETGYIVIPYDHSNIGICPASDLWFSFDLMGVESLDDFNSVVNCVLVATLATPQPEDALRFNRGAEHTHPFANLTFEALKNLLKKAANLTAAQKEFAYQALNAEFKFFGEQRQKFIAIATSLMKESNLSYLENLFSPTNNGFNITANMFDLPFNKNREVWTDGQCILIRKEIFASVYRELKNKVLK